MEPEPGNEDRASLAARVLDIMQRMRQLRAYLLMRGVDTQPFMAAGQIILDAEQGRVTSAETVRQALQTFQEFMARVTALPDFPPQWSPQEAEQWMAVGEILSFDAEMEELASGLKDSRSAPFGQEVEAFRTRLWELLENGQNPREEFENLQLSMNAEMGELTRRIRFTNAALCIYWETMPQEKWDELTPESRGSLVELLTQWRGEYREQFLGTLPMEDRRRLEAMEKFTPEDWAKQGMISP